MVAKVPDENTLDIKAAEIEAKAKKAKTDGTFQQIYDSIPSFAPAASTLVGVVDEEKGQFKILDRAFFLSRPEWQWHDVLSLGMKMAEGLNMIQACEALADEKMGVHTV